MFLNVLNSRDIYYFVFLRTICITYTSQLVYDLRDALQLMKERYGASLPSLITFASGPSRTADIEKTLVVGVHGPKEVYLFLVEA